MGLVTIFTLCINPILRGSFIPVERLHLSLYLLGLHRECLKKTNRMIPVAK